MKKEKKEKYDCIEYTGLHLNYKRKLPGNEFLLKKYRGF